MSTTPPATPQPPAGPQIKSFFHCKRCMAQLPPHTSPRNYAQLEIGFTAEGIQVWCKRHNVNVAHIDFEGHQHPAEMSDTGVFFNNPNHHYDN